MASTNAGSGYVFRNSLHPACCNGPAGIGIVCWVYTGYGIMVFGRGSGWLTLEAFGGNMGIIACVALFLYLASIGLGRWLLACAGCACELSAIVH